MDPTPQDFIDALEKQRNDALNTAANLAAENAALRRELEAMTSDTDGSVVGAQT